MVSKSYALTVNFIIHKQIDNRFGVRLFKCELCHFRMCSGFYGDLRRHRPPYPWWQEVVACSRFLKMLEMAVGYISRIIGGLKTVLSIK